MVNEPLAVLFPGQGSQSVGMLRGFQDQAALRQTFAEASDVLGFDLWQLVDEGPQEQLKLTAITQPAMLAADIAIWRLWRETGGGLPAVAAGHSLGEYAALVAAEVLSFTDAIRLVHLRGQHMQQAVPVGVGAMAAIMGLGPEQVAQVCQQASTGQELVSIANLNSPIQTVVAGHRQAVDRAVALADEAGARRAVLLPVSAPFHCALMAPAADAMAPELRSVSFGEPRFPVISNVDAARHDAGDELVQNLLRQIAAPVRWTETVEAIAGMGVTKLLECGPGKVLTGLNRRIDRRVTGYPLVDDGTLAEAMTAVSQSAGQD